MALILLALMIVFVYAENATLYNLYSILTSKFEIEIACDAECGFGIYMKKVLQHFPIYALVIAVDSNDHILLSEFLKTDKTI